MWVWGFGNHKWYKSLKSRVEDEWLDKTFVSHVISKTPYLNFRTYSISIVEKYKQAKRNYKWEEISFSKLNVLIYDSKSQCSHMWVHWIKNCTITFNLHDKLFYSAATIVVFNNVLCGPKLTQFWLPPTSSEQLWTFYMIQALLL